jgi:hypothetical protein
LGEFSPTGLLLTYFGQLFENYTSSPIFGQLFSRYKLLIHFDERIVGLHFERFFYKLIWAPCLQHALVSVTDPGEWPHMCAIFILRQGEFAFLSGASLIAPAVVLTAAHWIA